MFLNIWLEMPYDIRFSIPQNSTLTSMLVYWWSQCTQLRIRYKWKYNINSDLKCKRYCHEDIDSRQKQFYQISFEYETYIINKAPVMFLD